MCWNLLPEERSRNEAAVQSPRWREGVTHVKTRFAAALAVCMFVFLVAAVPSAIADGEPEAGTVFVLHSSLTFSLDVGHWEGTVKGPIRGSLELFESPANFIENGLEYFFEDFVITTTDGVIKGTDAGVYNLTTSDFWAHGLVTEAPGRWAFLVGYTLFEWGTTSPFGTFPITASHVPMVLLPPHPATADERLLVSYTDMAFSPEWGYWKGTTTGEVTGTIGFWEQPQNYIVGDVEFFFEAFTVTTQKGVLQGFDIGYYELLTGKFWAFGQVTQATRAWSSVEGFRFFEWGTTSPFPVFPITAEDVPFVLLGM